MTKRGISQCHDNMTERDIKQCQNDVAEQGIRIMLLREVLVSVRIM